VSARSHLTRYAVVLVLAVAACTTLVVARYGWDLSPSPYDEGYRIGVNGEIYWPTPPREADPRYPGWCDGVADYNRRVESLMGDVMGLPAGPVQASPGPQR
jgi:hypothetical protein